MFVEKNKLRLACIQTGGMLASAVGQTRDNYRFKYAHV